MFTKRSITTSLGAIASGLLLLASPPDAMALTASGVNISNQASVDYDVATVAQTTQNSNTTTFMVDAKVDLTVTGAANVNTTPGDTNYYALKFTVANTGNETFDFALAYEAGTQQFTSTSVAIHIDDGDGVWEGTGVDTAGTTLSNITAGSSAVVWLIGKTPASATDNQYDAYNLMATAELAGGGGAIPAEAADVVTTKQYVYADGSGPHSSDNANDTKHSDTLQFIAQTAALSITKSSSVIWDPVNLTVSPLHIPGAIVEYTIQIDNGAGAEQADAVVVTDVLDANLAVAGTHTQNFASGKSIQLTTPNLYSGAATALTDVGADDEATVSGQTVTVNGIVLAGGESATVKIRAEIQ